MISLQCRYVLFIVQNLGWDARGERAPGAEYHPFCLTMERQKKVGQKEIEGSESYNRSYCYVTLVSFYKLDQEDSKEISFKTPQQTTCIQEHLQTPISQESLTLFSPSGFSQHLELEETCDEEGLNAGSNTREKLNIFLASRDVSPIRTSMTIPWDTAAERTKRSYVRKGKQVALAALEELAPQNSEILFSAIQAERQKNADDMDSSLLEAMAECYENCSHWSSRRQMLSIIADKVRFATLQKWLPDLSRYRYNIARHHLFLHGRGTEVPQQKQKRIKVSPEKLDHFLAFITSAKIIQDLPLGEKTLKLSSGSEIKIPNVIRTSIPEQIIKQYQSYCAETGFSSPFSHSSLSRILNVCTASTRKSLQGLDYFSAEGAKAFDDLVEVADKLGDNYKNGLSWSKEVISKLKLAKRYFKEDYK
ncbi:Hypothetical predicted protein, partial [Paramuricea clavata]